MPRIRFAFAATVTALALLLTACGGGDGDATPSPTASASPTPTLTATVEPSASPQATTETPATPTPDADAADWAVPVYPRDTRTGIDIVDRALAVVLAGDASALAALADFRELPCTTESEGIGSFVCPEGVAGGTVLDAIQLAYCEGTYVRPEHIEASAETFFINGPSGAVEPLRLYAVARMTDDPTLAGSQYRLLLVFPNGMGRQVWLSDAGATMLWWGCGEVPVANMTVISSTEREPEFVLPPRTS